MTAALLLGVLLGASLDHVALASLAQRARPRGRVVPSEDVATAWRRGRR